MLQLAARIFLEEQFIGSHVKCWDYFLRITDQLPVQLGIKRLQVATVDVQKWRLQDVNLPTSPTS